MALSQITFGSLTLADGSSLAATFVSREDVGMEQATPEAVYNRATRPTYFGSRAVQRFRLAYRVQHPPAASLDEAKAARHAIPASFADTKVADLIITNGTADPVTYTAAKLVSVALDAEFSHGLSNAFLYTFEAALPDVGSSLGLVTWDGSLITWTAD